MKKIYIAIIVAMFGVTSAWSQAFWTVNYDMGVPLGDFSEYIGEPSWRGFSINGNGYLTDNILLGGSYHWSGFYEHNQRDTYQRDNGALTSEVWKKMYFSNFLFNASYMFIPEGKFQPYLGIGMGAYHVEQNTQAGRYATVSKNWKFGFSPQAGLYMPFGGFNDWGINVKATYNSIFYNVGDINTLSYLSVSVGIGFYAW
ncbi:MAG TPA: hypothetical protein ENI20_07465 [Bacteroides sp.]|nr:hypothetical protein [Bacteroides sp.]